MNSSPAAPLLEIRNLSKTFVQQLALDKVDLTLDRGRVEALVGHNGSGKSTLIKVLSGFHAPDPGSAVEVNGQPLKFSDPVASTRAGLRFIHQELGLLDNLTVLENLRLGGSYAGGRLGPIRWRAEHRAAGELLGRFGIDLDPAATLSSASPVQRTQLAIARALQTEDEVALLVLDEPTATLPDAEVEELFGVVRRVTSAGIGVLYVSHRLQELYQIADHLTVLRDGKVAGSGTPAEMTRGDLVQMITGAYSQEPRLETSQGVTALESPPWKEGKAPDSPAPELLTFASVTGGQLTEFNLRIGQGEVVGVAGLAGSGVHDLPGVLLGRISLSSGQVLIANELLRNLAPWTMRQMGVAVLPAARSLKSIQTLSVRENVTLPDLSPFWRRGLLRHNRERESVYELLGQYSVRPRDPERALATLSGGNQQKACVAKWMRTRPRVIVLDEPTAGVDIAGRLDILGLLRSFAQSGVAVVVCSSDLDDLPEFCDRVVIIRNGRNAMELFGDEITREKITAHCYA